MKKILLLAMILTIILNTGCAGGKKDKSNRIKVNLVTSNTQDSSKSSHSTFRAKYTLPGTTDKFFGVARNGYVTMWNEFQVTSLLVEGEEIINNTVDEDFTWHILSTPTVDDCDIVLDGGIVCPYDPTEPGKYRIRVDFHDVDGVYPDQSFNGVAMFYSGIWIANPLDPYGGFYGETCSKGYKFNKDGTLTPVDEKESADIYLGDSTDDSEKGYLFAPKGGIVKISERYEETLSLIKFNPDDYRDKFLEKLDISSTIPHNLYFVKCEDGYAKLGIFASVGFAAPKQLFGWFEFTDTNEFQNFD